MTKNIIFVLRLVGTLIISALLILIPGGASAATGSSSNIDLFWGYSNTAGSNVSTADESIPTDQIIIKYKSGTVADRLPTQASQMQRLTQVAGTSITYLREMSGKAHVLRLAVPLPFAHAEAISKKLMELPEVEYAEADMLAFPTLTPNDTLYTNQWDLFGTWGINAPSAWDVTTGSSSLVVAVIDTGITNHVDLNGRISVRAKSFFP